MLTDPTPPHPKMWRLPGVARMVLGCDPRTFKRAIERGELPFTVERIGRHEVIRAEEVQRYLAAREAAK